VKVLNIKFISEQFNDNQHAIITQQHFLDRKSIWTSWVTRVDPTSSLPKEIWKCFPYCFIMIKNWGGLGASSTYSCWKKNTLSTTGLKILPILSYWILFYWGIRYAFCSTARFLQVSTGHVTTSVKEHWLFLNVTLTAFLNIWHAKNDKYYT